VPCFVCTAGWVNCAASGSELPGAAKKKETQISRQETSPP